MTSSRVLTVLRSLDRRIMSETCPDEFFAEILQSPASPLSVDQSFAEEVDTLYLVHDLQIYSFTCNVYMKFSPHLITIETYGSLDVRVVAELTCRESTCSHSKYSYFSYITTD